MIDPTFAKYFQGENTEPAFAEEGKNMLFEIVELILAVWVECRILPKRFENALKTDLAIKRAGSVRFKCISLFFLQAFVLKQLTI